MAISSVGTSADVIRTDFMKLLVVQLQNQDPMEPLDNNEMASQLAQLSSLEQLENMNRTFRDVLASQQRLQAMELIGKEVDFLPEGGTEVMTGRVDGVRVDGEGIRLSIGQQEVELEAVQSIRADSLPAGAAAASGLLAQPQAQLATLGGASTTAPAAPAAAAAAEPAPGQSDSRAEQLRQLDAYLHQTHSPVDGRSSRTSQ